MDEALIARLLAAFALAAACLSPANAQMLDDPTRPPARLGDRGEAGAALGAAPQLQSVLIARHPGGRHVAVIDGDTVRLGETWKGARVARISQDEVELVRGKEKQVLKLPSPTVGAQND